MKKNYTLLLAVFVIVFASCSTMKLTDQEETIIKRGFDFREYMAKGFLFSPDPYQGEHDVLGIITIELHPDINYRTGRFPEGRGYTVKYITLENGAVYTQMLGTLDYAVIVKEIYDLSVEWGGDAFVHFSPSSGLGMTDDHSATSYSYIKISGTVIQRK